MLNLHRRNWNNMLSLSLSLFFGYFSFIFRGYILYIYLFINRSQFQPFGDFFYHSVGCSYDKNRLRLYLLYLCKGLQIMFFIGKKGCFNGSDFSSLPLSRLTRHSLTSADKKAVVYYTFNISVPAQIDCLIAFSGAAFANQSINFHLYIPLYIQLLWCYTDSINS